jgi:hypothetical protein
MALDFVNKDSNWNSMPVFWKVILSKNEKETIEDMKEHNCSSGKEKNLTF